MPQFKHVPGCGQKKCGPSSPIPHLRALCAQDCNVLIFVKPPEIRNVYGQSQKKRELFFRFAFNLSEGALDQKEQENDQCHITNK
jgi:hypothetical protein